jgi:hypothetical protein
MILPVLYLMEVISQADFEPPKLSF